MMKKLRFLCWCGYRVCWIVITLSMCMYIHTLWQYLGNFRIEGSLSKSGILEQRIVQWENRKPKKAWLMIGIPTVCRKNKNYLSSTLTSLINNMQGDNGVTIVVCICDTRKACRENIKTNLTRMFLPHVKRGLITMIETPEDLYAPLTHLKATFNDSETRVRWRSKQNLDYSFLMQHCANRSQYYLHLEDDVITVPKFISKIKEYMHKSKYWTMLEFSSQGFIGKLFKANDLGKLACLLRTFYNEQPCDYLIFYFLKLMLQGSRFIRIPSLFQHRGYFSSMPNLVRNSTVSYSHFPSFKKRYHGDNPEADIFTSLSAWMSFKPEFAYSTSDNEMFWSTTPRIGDHYTIVFKSPQSLARVVVLTGKSIQKADYLHSGILEFGTNVKSISKKNVACSNLSFVGNFIQGKINVDVSNSKQPTKCLKITVTKGQATWLIIREIAVYTNNKKEKH
ncbi:alpha-1,3-mannosyl-glycoprotein 4-beta-N-acetylglucosaminyltransferase C-like [Saccostrea echinata]|uniref:alpha-1,3-mannosyl-glycoprotein 4-beta-N-acetylglucosaminyltransferase C-like n=1 Tax=Saccostrea echinata TaxID=191078 RepID=UPI002A81757C|nr:alpha-1,3-mannosyl-glycoprotein 4-beta-N-acetylglucosaminyltransferase C-like [Saccostrea echinata]